MKVIDSKIWVQYPIQISMLENETLKLQEQYSDSHHMFRWSVPHLDDIGKHIIDKGTGMMSVPGCHGERGRIRIPMHVELHHPAPSSKRWQWLDQIANLCQNSWWKVCVLMYSIDCTRSGSRSFSLLVTRQSFSHDTKLARKSSRIAANSFLENFADRRSQICHLYCKEWHYGIHTLIRLTKQAICLLQWLSFPWNRQTRIAVAESGIATVPSWTTLDLTLLTLLYLQRVTEVASL